MMIGTEKENEFCVDWNNNNHNDAKRRELTKQHLMRMPYISNSRNQKMAVWTDIKEILFPSCDKNCEIVLEELKKTVNYPKHEKYMYPCSPRDHVSFLRQFRYVAIGTLLVQINKIDCNQVLWERVLKRHISPENDDHFCCSPATKGKSSQTVKEEGAFTVLKFHKVFVDRKSKSVQSSQAFVIPAFVGEKNQSGTTSHFIPLYLLGNNVPNVRKHLVDFCGHHIVRSANPYTHCCSVEEARDITIWQFNKLGGWGGHWRHLTTRDLLVSFEKCIDYLETHCNYLTVTRTSEDSVKIKMEVGAVQAAESVKSADVSFKKVKPKNANSLFPNLFDNYQGLSPKSIPNGSNLLDRKESCTLEKKRQRIKSPKDDTVVKWTINSTAEKTVGNPQGSEGTSKANNLPRSSTSATSNLIMSDTKIKQEMQSEVRHMCSSGKPSAGPPDINRCKATQVNLPGSKITGSRAKSTIASRTNRSRNDTVDDQTLMKLVSCNPFKHSIKALKAIREMNLHKEGKSTEDGGSTGFEKYRSGDMKERSPSKTKQIEKFILLPVITDKTSIGKQQSQVAKEQSGEKRFELPKNIPGSENPLSLLRKLVKENTSSDDGYKERFTSEVDVTSNTSKTIPDATKSLATNTSCSEMNISSFCCAQRKNSSACGKLIKANTAKSGRTCQGKAKTCTKAWVKPKTCDLKIADDLHTNFHKGVLKSKDWDCLKKSSAGRRVSFEIDDMAGKNHQGDQLLKSEKCDMISENERKTVAMNMHAKKDVSLQVEKHNAAEKHDPIEGEVLKSVVETKHKDDDLTASTTDDLKFHPKKRWAKHFLTVNSCSDEELDVENIEVTAEKPRTGKINECEEDDDEANDPPTCFDIENDARDRAVFEQRSSEIFLLKDINVDHEEVVEEKSENEINVIKMSDSDLLLNEAKMNLVSQQYLQCAESSSDSTLDEKALTIDAEQDRTEVKKHETCHTGNNKREVIHENPDKQIKTTTTTEKESQTDDIDQKSSFKNIKMYKQNSKKSIDICNQKKGKKKQKKCATSSKKGKTAKKGKPKVTKSACSVENESDEVLKAIRIQNVIEEQKRILNILTKRKYVEPRNFDKTEKERGHKDVSKDDLVDIEAGIFSRGTSAVTSSQLLETVKQSDDLGRKKGIRIKRKNKIEIKQEGSGVTPDGQTGASCSSSINPALEIDTYDIGYDVFRDDSGTEIGGLVLHPKFLLPYVLVNGFQYVALADACKLFPGCKKSCRILRNVLKKEPSLQLTNCTWEELYVLDLIYYAKGRRVVTGDPLVRFDVLIGRYDDLLCAVYQRHSDNTMHKCSY